MLVSRRSTCKEFDESTWSFYTTLRSDIRMFVPKYDIEPRQWRGINKNGLFEISTLKNYRINFYALFRKTMSVLQRTFKTVKIVPQHRYHTRKPGLKYDWRAKKFKCFFFVD